MCQCTWKGPECDRETPCQEAYKFFCNIIYVFIEFKEIYYCQANESARYYEECFFIYFPFRCRFLKNSYWKKCYRTLLVLTVLRTN